jgi:NAD-dependent SIR2 family protein deacetylase
MNPDAQALTRFLTRAKRVAVVSGAGVSTGSGIPDYRDRNGDWKHARPAQYAQFIGSWQVRQRYWARSFTGWSRIAEAEPNAAHHALATLESAGRIDTLITQNVDGLHHRAGSRKVIDLHGRLASVRCLDCGSVTSRHSWQKRLAGANPGWNGNAEFFVPDGDAQLEEENVSTFAVPGCHSCGGVVKPDVVFFGENVPRARVASALEATDRADALLVVGSSLMVFSGYRFARRAADSGKPVAIVNRGRTRADDIASLKIDAGCEDLLRTASRACV